ncbi:MAG: right-handed parallel beta-helix repeat-containing protein [Oscillospiraceae bacterium]
MQHFVPNICIDLPRRSGKVCSVAEFGAKTEETFCNIAAFRAAIDFCQKNPETVLTVPTGIYHFYTAPSNLHIPIHNISDMVLDGGGSEFIFHTPVAYFDIINSQRIHLKNFILDWAWKDAPLADVGVVRAVAQDGSYLEVAFPGCQTVPENMEIRIVGPFDQARYTPGCNGGIEFRPYENRHINLSGDEKSDEEMQQLLRELSDILLPTMEKAADNVLRIYTKKPQWALRHFKVGQCYNFRHFEYDGVAVRTQRSSHITLERITIYGCPGHGFLSSGGVHHLHFDHCRIQPRPGTAHSVSVTVDCLHVGNSMGQFIIEDCDFSGAGDDCINLHDNSSMGVRRLDDYTLKALRVAESALQFEKGSLIELRNSDLSPMGYTSVIEDLTYQPENRVCIMKLANPLPKLIDKDAVVFNRTFHTDYYVIRNCRFTNNRARGALLQGSHGLVENNLFENIQGAAIQIETGCESRWSEGQGVSDLLIRNNTIRHCDLNAWQMGVIYMGVYLPQGRTEYPIFEDIELCGNTIVDCPRLAGFFSSCRNVRVHHNSVVNGSQLDYSIACYGSSTMEKPIYGEHYEGVFQFAHSEDCSAENNLIFSTLI